MQFNTTRSYLFYDIETSGLNKCFDQVLQFAAIRTDLELNELERHEIFVKLSPDIIPSPKAIITHQIPLSQLLHGISEIEAIQQIHKLLNQPGTISIGYNSLGFDDEFLRFSFYRNLLPPYTHQYANQCGRMDLYPIAVMYFLFKNEALKWPKIEEKITFKLEFLNAANQLATGEAHNAMVDVIAAVELAKLLYKEKATWDYLSGYFNKATLEDRISKLTVAKEISHQTLTEAILVDSSLGEKYNYHCHVLGLGKHYHYKNKMIWLRLDKDDFNILDPEQIIEAAWAYHKKLGEDTFLLPFTEKYYKHLSKEGLALATNNKKWLSQNQELLKKLIHHHCNFTYPKIPNFS